MRPIMKPILTCPKSVGLTEFVFPTMDYALKRLQYSRKLAPFFRWAAVQKQPDGVHGFVLDDNAAPQNLRQMHVAALNAAHNNRPYPIQRAGSDTSIYGSTDNERITINSLFRYYHDMAHVYHCLDINTSDEVRLVTLHQKDLVRWYHSPHSTVHNELERDLLAYLLWIDTAGQVEFYHQHKRFVHNQLYFVAFALVYGYEAAVLNGSL